MGHKNAVFEAVESRGIMSPSKTCYLQVDLFTGYNPVDTRHRFNVYKTSIRRPRRRIDVL